MGKKLLESMKAHGLEAERAQASREAREANRTQTDPPKVSLGATPSDVGHKRIKEKRDIVIGFDFGTSSTKVVVQDMSLRRALAVPFRLGEPSIQTYLLPTQLFESNRTYSLWGSGEGRRDLKINLMEDIRGGADWLENESAAGLSAAYIALALKQARRWFLETQKNIYVNHEIVWWLNLGVPSRSHDEAPARLAFERVARLAWWISAQERPMSWSLIEEGLLKSVEPDFEPGIPAERIFVYPEIAAEVPGYAKSDARREGLLLLIDVGASTLDVSTFILHNVANELTYTFLEVDVRGQGVYFLHRHRLDRLFQEMKSAWDPLGGDAAPATIKEILPAPAKLAEVDEEFLSTAVSTVNRVLISTKNFRAPDQDEFNRDVRAPLRAFLCGGGSRSPFYRKLISTAEQRLRRNYTIGPFQIEELPIPENLEAPGVKAAEYHRLAVAYGLSFSALDLGRVLPPSEVDDFERQPKKQEYELITKDQV